MWKIWTKTNPLVPQPCWRLAQGKPVEHHDADDDYDDGDGDGVVDDDDDDDDGHLDHVNDREELLYCWILSLLKMRVCSGNYPVNVHYDHDDDVDGADGDNGDDGDDADGDDGDDDDDHDDGDDENETHLSWRNVTRPAAEKRSSESRTERRAVPAT